MPPDPNFIEFPLSEQDFPCNATIEASHFLSQSIHVCLVLTILIVFVFKTNPFQLEFLLPYLLCFLPLLPGYITICSRNYIKLCHILCRIVFHLPVIVYDSECKNSRVKCCMLVQPHPILA